MKVEAFSIGFGKPIYSWEKDGVKWQIGCLPFGGFVKIAGMQKEGSLEPYEIKDGFYSKSPWQRIKVAFAGPLVNIAFAFAAFTALWLMGGRMQPFFEFTPRIGWVDPNSDLYAKGVRPGDVIEEYDGRPFSGSKDLLLPAASNKKQIGISGYKFDYMTGQKVPFHYQLPTYLDPHSGNYELHTIGMMLPAGYLIYQPPVPFGSPMSSSGIEPGDRIVWANGNLLFSQPQLTSVINAPTVFLTVQRNNEILHANVPRVHVDDLQMNAGEKGEIDDWRHAAGMNQGRLQDVNFIPYNLSLDGQVLGRIDFLDETQQTRAFELCERCADFNPLELGDRIVAVGGLPVSSSYEILHALQKPHAVLIVERGKGLFDPIAWQQADAQFESFQSADLQKIASSIGTSHEISSSGNLYLLNPVTPIPFGQFGVEVAQKFENKKKEIEAQTDLNKRNAELKALQAYENQLMLGLKLKDRDVIYNPGPIDQFALAIQDMGRTLGALGKGSLNPKFMSGPVGIVEAVQRSMDSGVKNALFWMAVISLNLGLVNLLPIPVLDGGHICFAVFEAITKRQLKAKTMERLIVPFVGLIIAFFLFVTYHDILRLWNRNN